MTTNYIGTVHKSTAVNDALCGYFFHHDIPNLIVAKNNLLQFYLVQCDQAHEKVNLELEKEFHTYGNVITIKLIQHNKKIAETPGYSQKPLLFLLTKKLHAALIEPINFEPTKIIDQDNPNQIDEDFMKLLVKHEIPSYMNCKTYKTKKSDLKSNDLQQRFENIRSSNQSSKRKSSKRTNSCPARIVEIESNNPIKLTEPDHFSNLKGPFWKHQEIKKRNTINIDKAVDSSICSVDNDLSNNCLFENRIKYYRNILHKDIKKRFDQSMDIDCNLPDINSQTISLSIKARLREITTTKLKSGKASFPIDNMNISKSRKLSKNETSLISVLLDWLPVWPNCPILSDSILYFTIKTILNEYKAINQTEKAPDLNAKSNCACINKYCPKCNVVDFTYTQKEQEPKDSPQLFIRTRASAKINDPGMTTHDGPILCTSSHDGAVIALSMVIGSIKFIAIKATLNNEGVMEHFNCRVDPNNIVQIQFIPNSQKNNRKRILCIIFQDVSEVTKTCLYALNLREKYLEQLTSIDSIEFKDTPKTTREWLGLICTGGSLLSDRNTKMAIPTSAGGLLLVGQKTTVFHTDPCQIDKGMRYTKKHSNTPYFHDALSWCPIYNNDNNSLMFLLSESSGYLMILHLIYNEDEKNLKMCFTININYIGRSTIASVMVPLPYNHFFLGSKLANSELIKLVQKDEQFIIQVINKFENIGPIVDMCMIPAKEPLKRQSVEKNECTKGRMMLKELNLHSSNSHITSNSKQLNLITCSNYGRHGTLRLLTKGIGMRTYVKRKYRKDITNGFSLGPFNKDHILFSHSDSSSLENIFNPNDLIECNFDYSQPTLLLDWNDWVLCQITKTNIRSFDSNLKLTSIWLSISPVVACCSALRHQCLFIATEHLIKLSVASDGWIKAETQIHYDSPILALSTMCDLVACAFINEINIYRITTMTCIIKLNAPISIPNYIAFAISPDTSTLTLIITSSDLSLYFIELNGTVEWKQLKLNCQPRYLTSLSRHQLLLSAEYPCLLQITNNELKQINIYCRDMIVVNKYSSGKLLLLTRSDKNNVTASICSLNNFVQTHVETVPLNETPRRIAYHQSTDNLIVLVFHKMNLSNIDSKAIEKELKQRASYIAYSQCKNENTNGFPFAVEMLDESVCETRRPASKRKSSFTDIEGVSEANNPMEILFKSSSIIEEHAVLLLDRQNFKYHHSYFLNKNENGCSIHCEFINNIEYVFIGTAIFTSDDEVEPKSGRIIVFSVIAKNTNWTLKYHCHVFVEGAVYSMSFMNGHLLTTINCYVHAFVFANNELKPVNCFSSNSLSMYIKCKYNKCLVGDLMRSLELFNMVDGKLTSLGRDFNPNWVTAIEFINSDLVIGAEIHGNLYVCKLTSDDTYRDLNSIENQYDPKILKPISLVYLGQFINSMRCGSLNINEDGIVIGSTSGYIGQISQLCPFLYNFLWTIQSRLQIGYESLGNIGHADYMSYESEMRNEPSCGFIDGDLVESIKLLDRQFIKELLGKISYKKDKSITYDDLMNLIKQLQNKH